MYDVINSEILTQKKMEPLQLTIKRLWPKDKYTIGRLIHEGNHVSNTLGCILVGWNQKVGYLNNSWKALKPLMQRINTALLQGRGVK